MTTCTIEVKAGGWLTEATRVHDFAEAMRKGDTKRAGQLLFFSTGDMSNMGWIRAGDARIELTVDTGEGLIATAVAALEKELADERAKWLTRQQEILERIQQVRALPAPPEKPKYGAQPGDFAPGDTVLYVPVHAQDDLTHEDCERGVVTSVNDAFVFVRYGNAHPDSPGAATDASNLVKES